MKLLVENGADLLVHLGDIGSVGVIDAMAVRHPKTGEQIEVHMVYGNTDWEAQSLGNYARDLGMHTHDPSAEIQIDGKAIAFTHGHLNHEMDRLLAGKPDFLLHGHTHVQADSMHGTTRVINPGALFRASRHTVALLEPASGLVRVLDLASVAR